MTVEAATRRLARPLPGISFETPAPGRSAALPRLDVTGFAGYAQAGPLDVPVLVQDHARFLEVFGPDLVLAEATAEDVPAAGTGTGTGRHVTSLLGPTVRAFFDNGGRSCWVVRVGMDPTTSRFVVPGLVARVPGAVAATPPSVRPVVLEGRSPGAFLDQHAALARVRRRSLPTLPGSLAMTGWADGSVVVPASASTQPGDLVELVLRTGRTVWAIVRTRRTDETGRATLTWAPDDESWLIPVRDLVATGPLDGRVTGPDGDEAIVVDSLVVDGDGRATLVVRLTADRAPAVGDVVVVDDGGAEPPVTLTVDTPAVGDPGEGPARWVVRGWPAWRLLAAATGRTAAVELDRAAVLELDLATRAGVAVSASVEGLGMADTHPRWLGRLPSDSAIFGRTYRQVATGSPVGDSEPLDDLVDSPRFALAAPDGLPAVCLPLGLGLAYGGHGRPALTGPGHALARNGAASRDPRAFLDPRLAGVGSAALLEAARSRFLVEGEDLRGLHALLPLEDVAVVAAPDALHGTWRQTTSTPSPLVLGPRLSFDSRTGRLSWDDPFARAHAGWAADRFVLERSAERDFTAGLGTTVLAGTDHAAAVDRDLCGRSHHRVRALRRGVTSPWSNTVSVPAAGGPFDDCDAAELQAPHVALAGLLLSWTPADGMHEVQRSAHPLFHHETTTTRTPTAHHLLSRPAAGATYVRVRTMTDGAGGPWSETVVVAALPTVRWAVSEPDPPRGDDAVSTAALAVHRALGTMAAARQDLTALVSFPRWYDADLVERHLGLLGEDLDRLHAHHPWGLVASTTTETGTLAVPVDGAVAGRLARGSIQRGPWVAVAGAPLDDVLGVAAGRVPVDPARLRAAQVNSLLLTRRGVMLTGVDTLARDPRLRPVTVRRLLILVRRLAHREGRELVFEPNGPDLRRQLQTRFESALGLLYRLGALAGASTSEAYRVLCDAGLNPPRATDAGRVVVELQLAPSHPLEFVVVRLVRQSQGGFQLAEVSP